MSEINNVIPLLGMGTWGVGGHVAPDYSISISEWSYPIEYFIQSGGRHIDTASAYADGFTEKIVGKAVNNFRNLRSGIIVATKVKSDDLSFHDVIKSAYMSLERLGLDYIDLLYVHSPSEKIPLEETMEAFNFLYEERLVRAIGVSNFSKDLLERAILLSPCPIVANQVHYNLIVREPESSGLLDFCVQKKIDTISWRPLQPITFNTSIDVPPLYKEGAYKVLDDLAHKYNATPSQIALAWLFNQPGVKAVVKASTSEHIDEVMQSVKITLDVNDFCYLKDRFPTQFPKSDSIPLSSAFYAPRSPDI